MSDGISYWDYDKAQEKKLVLVDCEQFKGSADLPVTKWKREILSS